VHASRLEYYDTEKLKPTKEMRDQNAHQAYGYTIKKFPDIAKYDAEQGIWWVEVIWKGFEASPDFNSHRDLRHLLEAVPTLTLRYLRRLQNGPTSKALKDQGRKMAEYLGLDNDWITDKDTKMDDFNHFTATEQTTTKLFSLPLHKPEASAIREGPNAVGRPFYCL